MGGAIEESARDSAEGVVQDLGYRSTFPLLLNIGGQPTYFMSLKDSSELVKQYAMVNVSQYHLVATGTTVAECEENYLSLLSSKGVASIPESDFSVTTGVIADIRSAVMDGTSYYFIRLENEGLYCSFSAAKHPLVVILNVGDKVEIRSTQTTQGSFSGFLEGYEISLAN